jgi:hypothetical protein
VDLNVPRIRTVVAPIAEQKVWTAVKIHGNWKSIRIALLNSVRNKFSAKYSARYVYVEELEKVGVPMIVEMDCLKTLNCNLKVSFFI